MHVLAPGWHCLLLTWEPIASFSAWALDNFRLDRTQCLGFTLLCKQLWHSRHEIHPTRCWSTWLDWSGVGSASSLSSASCPLSSVRRPESRSPSAGISVYQHIAPLLRLQQCPAHPWATWPLSSGRALPLSAAWCPPPVSRWRPWSWTATEVSFDCFVSPWLMLQRQPSRPYYSRWAHRLHSVRQNCSWPLDLLQYLN